MSIQYVGKTLLVLPKCRYINGFTKYNVWETVINYYHKYINELYTNDNSYPLEVLKKKYLNLKIRSIILPTFLITMVNNMPIIFTHFTIK